MTDTREGSPGGQQELAALYSRVAPIYAEQGPPFFEHAGRRLVELAQVRPGDVVLDVATGRGAVLIPAARRAGPAGQVVGIDIAPGMVDYTRRSIQDQGLTHASVALMDAAHRTGQVRGSVRRGCWGPHRTQVGRSRSGMAGQRL